MSRDRIINRKRSKHTIIAAAGVLVVTTAALAVTGASAPGPVASTGLTSAAGSARLTVPGQPGASASQRVYLVSQEARFSPARQLADLMMYQAEQRAAAARRAAAATAAKEAAKAAKEREEAQLAARQAAVRRAAAREAAKRQAAQPQATVREEAQKAAVVTATPGSTKSIAQSMLGSYGWSPSEFSCLDPLWAHESGWSVTASNPSSGAYGIPQALPGAKMASAGANWRTDAATQIRWGLNYIKDTYGSPCAAWSHEQSDGWY